MDIENLVIRFFAAPPRPADLDFQLPPNTGCSSTICALTGHEPSVNLERVTKKVCILFEKKNGTGLAKELGKTYRRHICSRAENFAHPFTTNQLLERI